jgi:hypothetical protein
VVVAAVMTFQVAVAQVDFSTMGPKLQKLQMVTRSQLQRVRSRFRLAMVERVLPAQQRPSVLMQLVAVEMDQIVI